MKIAILATLVTATLAATTDLTIPTSHSVYLGILKGQDVFPIAGQDATTSKLIVADVASYPTSEWKIKQNKTHYYIARKEDKKQLYGLTESGSKFTNFAFENKEDTATHEQYYNIHP